MDKIVLNNGTEIENGSVSEVAWAKGKLYVFVPGNDLVGTAVLFGNPENSKKIEFYHSIYKDIYYGYTMIENIGMDSDNTRVEIWIAGNEDSRHEQEYTVPKEFTPEVIVKRFNELDKENNENGPESTETTGNLPNGEN